MRTLLLAASGLSLLLFTACAGPAPIDQQIRKLAEQVGAEHLGA